MSRSADAGDAVNLRPRFAIIGGRGYPSTYGGFETFVRRFAPYLVARGCDAVVYGHGGIRWYSTECVDGVFVVRAPGIDSKSLTTLSHSLSAVIHASIARANAALLLNVANGLFIPLLRAARIPVAINVDGLEWERGKWNWAARKVFRMGASCATRLANEIVVDSSEIQAVWRRDFGRAGRFIPYGADVIPSAPRIDPLRPGYALVVARLAPENNVDMFLDAIEAAPWPSDVVVVGDANYDNPTIARLKRLHRDGRLFWYGHVEDQARLIALWSHCGVYFHGHSVGGTNPALLQAMACGAPTVAFDSVFNREVLGPQGVYVSDALSLREELERIAFDPAVRRALAGDALARATAQYRWQDVCDRYLEVLCDIATPPRSSTLNR